MTEGSKNEPDYSPVYYPKNINEDILISEEPAVLTTSNGKIPGQCKIVLKSLPITRLGFFIDLDITDIKFIFGDPLENIKELHLPERNLHVPGFPIAFGGNLGKNNKASITWCLKNEPLVIKGNHDTHLSEVIFHINNLKDFYSLGKDYVHKTNAGGLTALFCANFLWRDWDIEIRSLPQTSDIMNDLKANGGSGLTHVGILRKRDNSTFESKHAENIIMGLRFMLSFAKGAWCTPALLVGFDEHNQKKWESLISPDSGYNFPQTWFDIHHVEQLEILFPKFMDKWVDDSWNETIRSAIYWYLKACDSHNGIDLGIILIQAAIERLAYEYAVNQKKLLTLKGFKDLWASDKFRLLFSSIDIPLDIHMSLRNMIEAKTRLKWLDAPQAFTEVRNSLVHPDHKRGGELQDIYYETWKMGLWYLELAILRLCGYDHTYSNRLTSKMIGDIEKVPWDKG